MISVVIATHNEELNIKRCLKSVKGLADEVIVVDGESTDETVKLAKKLGAKVIQTTNKANFHINKQLAMDEARGQLVLQLDADEEVDAQLAQFIKQIHQQYDKLSKSELKKLPVAWWIKRKNLFLGKFLTKGGQYPDPVIRLYVNGFAKLPQQDVHEQMKVTGEIDWAEGHLIHYANPTFQDYLRKFNTYTSFKASQLRDQQIKINLLNSVKYLIWKPMATFLLIYIRHKGLVDGFPGFVFSLFSGLHHAVAYLKLWELYIEDKK